MPRTAQVGSLHVHDATRRRRRCRRRFSSLQGGFVFLDAPGGSQVPDEVGEAIARALREASGNLGAPYATGRARRGDPRARAAATRAASSAAPPDDVIVRHEHDDARLHALAHGRRATATARATEILTSRLDHDGGVAPWVELAADTRLRGATSIDGDRRPRPSTTTTSSGSSNERTRVVAFAIASNAVGSIADAQRICASSRARRARSRGSTRCTTRRTSRSTSQALGCDVLLCSPYKFCGPHLGLAYVPARARSSRGARTRRGPSGATPVGRKFETGTAAVRAARRLLARRSRTSSRSAACT